MSRSTLCIWKLQIANQRELNEFANRDNAARAIVRAFANNSDDDEHPLFRNDNGAESAAQLGWDVMSWSFAADPPVLIPKENWTRIHRNAKLTWALKRN
jgi:hypothetical protein